MNRTAPQRIHDLIGDSDGAAMLEFVILAPVLSYLLIGIFFFHHHIDYAQDATVRFRHLTWKYAPPGAGSASESASEADGFTPLVGIRSTVQLAPGVAIGSSLNLGGTVAAERYFGGGAQTPYSRLSLPYSTYLTNQRPIAQMPTNPWARTLGSLGRFFGNRIGSGSKAIPSGYDIPWEEKFPMIVNPWQRYLSRGDFTELAITKAGGIGGFSAAEVVMTTMDGLTLFRSNTFSDVHKVDSALDGETRKNELKTQSYSGSTRNSIFK